MKTIAISEASAAQLAEFASSHLGMLGIQASHGKERLIELISAAGHNGDTIEVNDTERKPRAKAGADGVALSPDRKVRIHIATGEGASGARPVEVAVNGVLMLIPRGKDVEVPWKYLHVLQNAKASQAEVDDDGQITGWREAPLYPVSVLGI